MFWKVECILISQDLLLGKLKENAAGSRYRNLVHFLTVAQAALPTFHTVSLPPFCSSSRFTTGGCYCETVGYWWAAASQDYAGSVAPSPRGAAIKQLTSNYCRNAGRFDLGSGRGWGARCRAEPAACRPINTLLPTLPQVTEDK